MKGQWIGRTTGRQVGQIILNVDDIGSHFSGVAITLPDDANFPLSASFFDTKDKSPDFNFIASVKPIDPRNSLICEWKDIQNLYPEGMSHANYANVSGHFEENDIHLQAETDNRVTVQSHIIRKTFSDYSDLLGEKKTWDEYKSYAATLSRKEYLYRGQEKPWKLRTSFHRHGRYNLFRFQAQDIPKLHRRLTARTKHVFNLLIPDENGAFLNLAQNHGYPTPLLDWTYSPYVAAFFAFRKIPKKSVDDTPVRIFIFDQEKWKSDWRQLPMLNTAGLHLSILEFLAIDNQRLIPQQAATTVTNIDDIEAYVAQSEEEKNYKYLWAIDIPSSERNKVLNELSYMGITAGSMFPGLDGACEELREKLFDE